MQRSLKLTARRSGEAAPELGRFAASNSPRSRFASAPRSFRDRCMGVPAENFFSRFNSRSISLKHSLTINEASGAVAPEIGLKDKRRVLRVRKRRLESQDQVLQPRTSCCTRDGC
jgi:hypothetical protein